MSNSELESIQSVSEFLGKERIDDLKDFVLHKLKDNMAESIEYKWVTTPSDFEEMWDELFESCKKDIVKEYKKTLKGAIRDKVEAYIAELSK